MPKIFAQILLPLSLDEDFTYFCGQDLKIGNIVEVEFRRKKTWGVVTKISNQEPSDFDPKKIKEILQINQRFSLSEKQLNFIEKISAYNLGIRGLVLRAFIGILNSDKVKKIPQGLSQNIDPEKFSLKKLLPAQEKIYQEFCQIKPKVSLIDGATGSGKTEVYFAIIAKILKEDPNSQILILLPEIALTSQIMSRFEEQFAFKPALWHSQISKKEKREAFYGIVEGTARVIIGARSALLLPFKNLKLAILDEEHDHSFKQEDVFNFHARDMAILKGQIENFEVILSSATQSVETYINVNSQKYHKFALKNENNGKNDIKLVDLRQEKLEKDHFLSKKLKDEIAQNLLNKKQTLLFLNRRGYAPVTLCKECGKKYECSNCDFHLVLHKKKNQLTCHHCGHNEKMARVCKFCGAEDSLVSIGAGIEKVEEEVRGFFPQANIAMVTSDTVTGFEDAKNLVEKISSGQVDIIIGTQMISKGYDFANISLVGVIDADSMLYSSSLRALERSYQILTQVIGRTGRRKEKGQVIIQTFNPNNLVFEKITKFDQESFFAFEAQNREMLELPPFSKMAKLEISSFKEFEAKNFAKRLISLFPIDDRLEILGPAPAPIKRLKNRHHFLINLKASKKINLQKLIKDVIKTAKAPNSIRIRIDIDPI